MKLAIGLTVALGLGTLAFTARKADPAWESTKVAVLDKIKTPATAQFGEPTIEKIGSGSYAIAGYVDCENLYGATVREKFEAIVVNGEVAELRWGSARDTFERVRQELSR